MYADGINMHKEQKLAGGQKKVSAAVTGSFCSGNGSKTRTCESRK